MDSQALMTGTFEAVEYNAKLRLVEQLRRDAYREKARIEEQVIQDKLDPIEAVEKCKAVFRDFKWKRNAVLKAKFRVDGSIAFSGKSVCGKCLRVRVCPLGPTSHCALFVEAKL